MARALRKSGLPVWYSQGFNPHIYMSFALPLPLMVESEAECVDVKTECDGEDFSRYVAALNAALPRGIRVKRIAAARQDVAAICAAMYRFEYEDAAAVKKALQAYAALERALVLRKTKRSEEEVDLKAVVPQLTALAARDNVFELVLPAGNKLHYSPALVSGFFEQVCGLPACEAKITRLRVITDAGVDFE